MSTLSIRLPDFLHAATKKLTEKEHISLNQFITLAIAEKLSALTTESVLQQRAAKGNRKKFLQVLKKVPDQSPDDQDKL